MCGQGRGRTADLPLFRRTLVPTELPDQDARCSAVAPTAAVLTGFEPATSTLTGWRALQLLYRTIREACRLARKSISPTWLWLPRPRDAPERHETTCDPATHEIS